MGLSDLKHVSNISSVSAKTSVTQNAKTGTVWKCTVDNLETKVLPSPDSGARYHGIALIIDSSGNLGAFCLVAANPRSSASGGMAAREIWLDTLSTAFLQNEFGTEQASKFTELTVPSSGYKIAFASITGSSPQNANNITPESFSGGCVEATLRDHRLDLMEEVLKLKASLDALNAPSLGNLLLSDYSILSGSLLTWSSGLQVSISSGSGRYKGVEFTHVGGTLSGFTDKQLARVLVDQSGNYAISPENSSGGTLDSDYNPSGTTPLPTAASPVWTASGTASVEAVANGVLGLSVSANTRIYTRSGVTGPPASGSTLSAWLQYVSGSGFQCEVDHGGGNNKEGFTVGAGFVSLNSSGQKFYFDTTKPFHVRLTLQNAISRLYINGQLALQSTAALAGSSNQVRWGFLTSSTGSMNIGRLIFRSAIALVPTWQSSAGAVIGAAATMSSTFAAPLGLQVKEIDLKLGHREENRLANISDLRFIGKLPTNYHDLRIVYKDANTVTIKAGSQFRDLADSYDIVFNQDYDVALNVSGAGGLDTGTEAASTWYNLYVYANSSTGAPGAVFSVTNESVSGSATIPSGGDKKRQVRFAVRNDGSSNILPFNYRNLDAFVRYQNFETGVSPYRVYSGSATTWTGVSLVTLVPPISTTVQLHSFFGADAAGTLGRSASLRKTGSGLTTGILIGNAALSYETSIVVLDADTDTSQSVDIKSLNVNGTLYLDVLGYYITGVL